jgi:DNA-binding transcriptional LysR family regulator
LRSSNDIYVSTDKQCYFIFMDQFGLECFVALAEELHFGRAAERCHITQPAMSQQIRRLEEKLKVQLAERSKREVKLTLAGEVFLVEARRILRHLERAVQLARRTGEGVTGHVTIGATAPSVYVLVPEVLQDLRKRRPDLEVVLYEMTTAEQERALRNGDIDAGIVHPPLDDPQLECLVVSSVPFHAALPAGHPLAYRDHVRFTDLAEETFILFPRETAPQLYDTIIKTFHDAGFTPKLAMAAHPAQSIIARVAAGFGIGLIAGARQRMDRPGVIYRPIELPCPSLSLGIASRPHPSAAVRALMESAVRIGAVLE